MRTKHCPKDRQRKSELPHSIALSRHPPQFRLVLGAAGLSRGDRRRLLPVLPGHRRHLSIHNGKGAPFIFSFAAKEKRRRLPGGACRFKPAMG
jgi:hypothetical protein